MQSLWLENNTISIRNTAQPEIPEGEALIRLIVAGVCSTDLELVKGYYPYTGILGHEFVGEVLRSDSMPELVGKRVVGEINAVCHTCETCLRGDETHCENRTVLGIVNRDGAFAEYLVLPCENLHEVPETIPDEAAVFTEPLAAALEILDQVDIKPSDQVLVIGAGRLGQFISRVLAQTGCRLSVSARYETQRRLLEEAGIRWIEAEAIGTGKYDIVVEATGSEGGFRDAQTAVRPRGTIILKSTYAGSISVNFSDIVVNEITLVGSRCGPFDRALRWLEDEKIQAGSFIHDRFRLQDGLAAFERASSPGVIKVLLYP